ncbi:MAG: MFS transporter [Bifidobacteriaceae bacterium]|nr:MFS transporter [Bifidobacteriaceae bacterium]
MDTPETQSHQAVHNSADPAGGQAASPRPKSPRSAGSPPTHSWRPRAHAVSWATLAVTTGAILMTSIDGGILPAVLPAIVKEFDLTTAQAGLVNSVFFAALLVGAFGFGWLSDRIGTGYRRTWTWNTAMLLAIVGGVATFGLSGGFTAFLLLRIPMGLSRGGSEPINVALVGEWWPKEHRGFAVGVHHTGFPLGQFLTGALIAGVLGVAGWREAFLLIPMLGLVIVIAQGIIGTRRNQQRVYDWIDANGLTKPLPELSPRLPGGLMAPLKACLANANVRWSVLLIFLFLYAEYGASTFLTTQFVDGGMDFAEAALVAGASGLTGWIGQVVWGTWSDRFGRKPALTVLVLGWAASLVAMIFIGGAASGWVVLLAWGLFRNAPYPVVYALILDSVPRAAGTGMGLLIGISSGLSGVVAAAASGWVIEHFGFTAHYVILAVIALTCLIPLARITETVQPVGQAPAGPTTK